MCRDGNEIDDRPKLELLPLNRDLGRWVKGKEKREYEGLRLDLTRLCFHSTLFNFFYQIRFSSSSMKLSTHSTLCLPYRVVHHQSCFNIGLSLYSMSLTPTFVSHDDSPITSLSSIDVVYEAPLCSFTPFRKVTYTFFL